MPLSKEQILEQFHKNESYLQMKQEVEQQFFKMLGDYCKFDGEKIIKLPANKISEHFKNKKVTVKINSTVTLPDGSLLNVANDCTKKFYDIWSEDPLIKTYDEIVFDCNVEKVKPNQFNLYTGLRQFDEKLIKKSKKVDLEPIYEHMKSLVNYNDEHFNYLLNYLAQLVQQSHILPHTSLIFISKEGVGKDIFSNFLSKCINEKYTLNTEKLDNICGKFNSMLGGKLLTTINETNPVESRERIENIKYLITADTITIEGKHRDPIKAKNYCRFMFFSNRLFAFPVEESSRRPVIFHSSDKYLKDVIGAEANNKYFTELVSYYDDELYQCAFLQMLKNRDISKFNPKEFTKSQLHQELEDNSVSPLVGWLSSLITKKENKEKEKFRLSTVIALNDCIAYMKENNYKYELSQSKFNTELSQLYNIKKIKSNGNNYFEFVVSDIKEMLIKKYKYNFDKEQEPVDEESDDEIENVVDDNYIKMQEELNELRRFRAMYQKEWEYFKSCQVIENKANVDDETDDDEIEAKKDCKVTDDDLVELSNVLDKL